MLALLPSGPLPRRAFRTPGLAHPPQPAVPGASPPAVPISPTGTRPPPVYNPLPASLPPAEDLHQHALPTNPLSSLHTLGKGGVDLLRCPSQAGSPIFPLQVPLALPRTTAAAGRKGPALLPLPFALWASCARRCLYSLVRAWGRQPGGLLVPPLSPCRPPPPGGNSVRAVCETSACRWAKTW